MPKPTNKIYDLHTKLDFGSKKGLTLLEAGSEYIGWMVFKGYKVTEAVNLYREGAGTEIQTPKLNREIYYPNIY
jgi:hypothetical protein